MLVLLILLCAELVGAHKSTRYLHMFYFQFSLSDYSCATYASHTFSHVPRSARFIFFFCKLRTVMMSQIVNVELQFANRTYLTFHNLFGNQHVRYGFNHQINALSMNLTYQQFCVGRVELNSLENVVFILKLQYNARFVYIFRNETTYYCDL